MASPRCSRRPDGLRTYPNAQVDNVVGGTSSARAASATVYIGTSNLMSCFAVFTTSTVIMLHGCAFIEDRADRDRRLGPPGWRRLLRHLRFSVALHCRPMEPEVSFVRPVLSTNDERRRNSGGRCPPSRPLAGRTRSQRQLDLVEAQANQIVAATLALLMSPRLVLTAEQIIEGRILAAGILRSMPGAPQALPVPIPQ